LFLSTSAAAQDEASAKVDVQASFGDNEPSADNESEEPSSAAQPAGDEAVRAIRFRLHNSWDGPIGGIHVIDAGSAPAGTLRVQLGLNIMSTSDFIVPGDVDDYLGGTVSVTWTFLDFLEAYFDIESHGNYNTMAVDAPHLAQVLGDITLGLKGFYEVIPWLTIGGDLRVKMMNTMGDLGLFASATSFGLRGNVTADFQRLESKVPLIARFNLGYFFDNSSALIKDTEKQQLDYYMSKEAANADPKLEWHHLTNAYNRFAYGINRVDLFTFALGLEAPIPVTTDFYINPILEWIWGIPVNRQGFECVQPYAKGDNIDGCLQKEGAASFPMDLTLGLRVLPPVKGLAASIAADIGI